MKKQAEILCELRKNARIKLTELAAMLGLSISALHYQVKQIAMYVKRWSCLLNPEKLGYPVCSFFVIEDVEVTDNLLNSPYLNSILQTSNELIAEFWFNNVRQLNRFEEYLHKMNVRFSRFIVVEELKRESFIPDNVD